MASPVRPSYAIETANPCCIRKSRIKLHNCRSSSIRSKDAGLCAGRSKTQSRMGSRGLWHLNLQTRAERPIQTPVAGFGGGSRLSVPFERRISHHARPA